MTATSHETHQPTHIAVVACHDEVDIAALPRLRDDLERAVAGRPGLLVVDLSGCPLLEAQAVPVLVEAARAVAEQRGLLVLRGASEQVARLVSLADADGELRLQSV